MSDVALLDIAIGWIDLTCKRVKWPLHHVTIQSKPFTMDIGKIDCYYSDYRKM